MRWVPPENDAAVREDVPYNGSKPPSLCDQGMWVKGSSGHVSQTALKWKFMDGFGHKCDAADSVQAADCCRLQTQCRLLHAAEVMSGLVCCSYTLLLTFSQHWSLTSYHVIHCIHIYIQYKHSIYTHIQQIQYRPWTCQEQDDVETQKFSDFLTYYSC